MTGAAQAAGRAAAGDAIPKSSMSGSVGGAVAADVDRSIRMTGIVWKRRSGLGKYSTTAAWERRRIVLEGTKLLYYKANNSTDDDASVDDASEEFGQTEHSTASSGWLGSMRSSMSTQNVARGDLDLLKENASISASYGHTGAPTPFALSIKILGQTKWKLCFDTHEELMEWLAAMTDVVVQGSVDSYNALILEAYDPRNTTEMTGQMSEPPSNLSPQYTDHKEAAGGHRLWSTGHYNVRSVNFPDAGLADMEGILEDVNSDDDEDEDQVAVIKEEGANQSRLAIYCRSDDRD